MLRQNGEPSAYKAAVSCYSGGRFEHCVISLVEDVDKKGAKWVFQGMPQDEVRRCSKGLRSTEGEGGGRSFKKIILVCAQY